MNTGGKTIYLVPKESKTDSDKGEKKEEKVKVANKTKKSIRNLILAFVVGLVSFLPAFIAMYYFGNIPMPDILASKTSFPVEDWNFLSDLIVSLIFSAIVLLAANSVAEEKNKWTNGISWALICILFCWLVGYYGYFRKVEPQIINHQTVVYDPNPFSNQVPTYSLYLDKGEKSFWIDWKVGYNLDTWSNFHNYKYIYEDGSVVTIKERKVINLPNPGKDVKIRLESLSDNQVIYVYIKKI